MHYASIVALSLRSCQFFGDIAYLYCVDDVSKQDEAICTDPYGELYNARNTVATFPVLTRQKAVLSDGLFCFNLIVA